MTDQLKVSSETAQLMQKIHGLEPTDERYQVIKAALDYKTSWLDLAERLNLVALNKIFKEWGYNTFKSFCDEELQLPQSTAKKLVRGFQWIDAEAPDMLGQFLATLQAAEDGSPLPAELPLNPVPELETIDVLVNAQKQVANERLSTQAYAELKEKALTGESTARELKKDLRDAMPEPEESADAASLKVLRKTLSATERIIAQLEEVADADPQIMELAQQLRERVFEVVSSKLDAQAYATADQGVEP